MIMVDRPILMNAFVLIVQTAKSEKCGLRTGGTRSK